MLLLLLFLHFLSLSLSFFFHIKLSPNIHLLRCTAEEEKGLRESIHLKRTGISNGIWMNFPRIYKNEYRKE